MMRPVESGPSVTAVVAPRAKALARYPDLFRRFRIHCAVRTICVGYAYKAALLDKFVTDWSSLRCAREALSFQDFYPGGLQIRSATGRFDDHEDRGDQFGSQDHR